MSAQRALLFANGVDPKKGRLKFSAEDYLIAVDAGLKHLLLRGFLPNLLVGDLDSIDPKALQKCAEGGIEILRFPPEKDETDLELALNEAAKRGFSEVVIAFGLGGRIDHMLGNLALLGHPVSKNVFVYFDDGQTKVTLLDEQRSMLSLRTEPGDLVSLIPWQGDASGIHTEGLKYSLQGETLYANQARGVSNLALGTTASVSCETGALLLIHQVQVPKKGKKS